MVLLRLLLLVILRCGCYRRCRHHGVDGGGGRRGRRSLLLLFPHGHGHVDTRVHGDAVLLGGGLESLHKGGRRHRLRQSQGLFCIVRDVVCCFGEEYDLCFWLCCMLAHTYGTVSYLAKGWPVGCWHWQTSSPPQSDAHAAASVLIPRRLGS